MYNKFSDAWEGRYKIQPNVTKFWLDNNFIKGRDQYLTFHIRIRDENLVKKIIEIQSRLSAFSCVDPLPKDYFHISITGLGFLTKSEKYEDDILIENLQRIINQAKEALQPISKFDIVISKPNIFPDVVFMEVHDEGKIEEIFQRLQAIPEVRKKEFIFPSFLPHISIVMFQNNKDFTKLISQLEKLRNTELGTKTVNSIELVNVYISMEYPKLRTIATFQLK
jgi:2'-5' RNA ligase